MVSGAVRRRVLLLQVRVEDDHLIVPLVPLIRVYALLPPGTFHDNAMLNSLSTECASLQVYGISSSFHARLVSGRGQKSDLKIAYRSCTTISCNTPRGDK